MISKNKRNRHKRNIKMLKYQDIIDLKLSKIGISGRGPDIVEDIFSKLNEIDLYLLGIEYYFLIVFLY